MGPAKNNLIGITMVAALGGLLFGYDTAVISGTVNALDHYFIAPRGLPEVEAGALLGSVVASALIGCIIGGALASVLCERFGRRRILSVAAILFLLSALGSAFPETGFATIGEGGHLVWLFVCYRIVGGIGVGLASVCAPMYIAEIAPPAIRGRLVSYNQFAIVSGIVIAYFVNFGISLQGDETWNLSEGWRWMFAAEAVPALWFFLLLKAIPESPRWLVMQGSRDAARQVLSNLHGAADGARELAEIGESGRHSSRLFSFGIPLIVLGVMLSVFQQLVGINAVLYYAPEIFRSMGLGGRGALLQTVIVGAVNMVFTIVAIRYVDRLGRRKLMISGACLMSLAMTVLGLCLAQQSTGPVALLAMLLFVASFAFSWGPVCWVLLSEIFPNRIRGKALAVAVAAQWISNYLVSATFPMLDRHPYLVERFHHGFAYWLYGAMALAAAFFVWRWIPETAGKSLEEMEDLWRPDAGAAAPGVAPNPVR
jgi:SP family xylose:H+ symportor-like MFS transporter